MAQRKKINATPNKRNRSSLEYQRFEDRNLLAADFGVSIAPVGMFHAASDQVAIQPTEAIRQHLAATEDTATLQKGLSQLTQVATETANGQTTTVYQQLWNGLPVYNSFVTVVQNESGDITNVRDNTQQDLRGYANDATPISSEAAIAAATRGLGKPTLMESSTHSAWFYAGNKARLAWVVETSVVNPQGELVSEHETWVNVFDGGIFAREAKGSAVAEQLADPLTEVDVHPWVVINDEIGPDGARSYAAPFDAVVFVSVGCTGTLIAPNAFLSARHCGIGAGDSISFGDDRNNPDFTIDVATSINPGGGDAGSNLLDGGDVSLHTLVGDVPASVATPMRFVDATDDLVGSVALWIGYGRNGVGSAGSDPTPDGMRWAAENIIDAYGAAAPIDFGANIFTSDFDDGTLANSSTGSEIPLEFEGMGGPGDSGGPMLVQVNGEWVIGAVVSGGTTRNSVYGTTGWWSGTSIYRSQIEAIGGEFLALESEIGFNRDEYFVGDTINVSLLDGNATGDITLTVTSDIGDTETLTVAPTSPGEYNFTLESANSNIVINDGTIQVEVGSQIELTYVDSDDGNGNQVTLNDTAIFKAVTASDLIGVDFDQTGASPLDWLTVSNGSNANFGDLNNEQGGATPVDLTVNGTWTGLDVAVNADTIPMHPNSLANVDGQIQTSGQSVQLIYSDLVASTDYLVYVMSAEGIFDSIEQTVSIQGLGSAVVFEQRFNKGELFVNDQVGNSNRELTEYAQLITSDIDGRITINVDPINGTQDVVLAGVAIVPDTGGIDAVSDSAVTGEDQLVAINVVANDTETNGETISLDSVSTPENGTATINANGTVDYVPANNFVGTDSFTYTISDTNGNTATGAVTVVVSASNDAPISAFLLTNSVREDADTSSNVFIGTLIGQDVDNTSHTFQLVDGLGSADNNRFLIQGDSLSIKAGTNIDFDKQPQYSIRVLVSDGELSTESVLTIDVIEVNPVVQVAINGGDTQRSMLRNNVITFSDIVTINPGAFELIKRGPGGGTVDVVATIDNSSGQSVVTLTYGPGEFVAAGGSLVDGNYQLTVFGDQVTTSTGAALDGDEDGTAGGNFVYGDTAADNFFRFFGDVDGDRIVTTLDLLRLRQTWLAADGDSNFDDRFDRDNDGVISTFDLLFFRKNYLDRLDFA